MTAVAKEVHDQCTAVIVIDDLMRHAKAALDRSETNLKQCFDRRLTAGYEFIKARQMCRDQGISWSAKLKEHGIDRTMAHLAIAEAGGDAAIDDEGRGRPGGIKAKASGTRAEQRKKYDRDYYARKRQQLLLVRTTNQNGTTAHDQTIPIRQPSPREAFEEWASVNVGQPNFSGRHVRDGVWAYDHNIMQLCWACWKASAASLKDICK